MLFQMKITKIFTCLAVVTLCILASANARDMFRRSPQEDYCVSTDFPAWHTTFCAFKAFCDDGTVGKCEGGTRGENPGDAWKGR